MEAEVQEAPVCPPPVPKPKATIITTTVESTPAATESQTQAGASPNGGAQPKREPSTEVFADPDDFLEEGDLDEAPSPTSAKGNNKLFGMLEA